MAYYILDLDHTLVNTAYIKQEIKIALQKLGIPAKKIDSSYLKTVSAGSRYGYSPEKHAYELAKESGLDRRQIVKAIYNLKGKKILYPDAADFLLRLKQNSQKIILVTRGYKKWQQYKLMVAGISCFFDKIIISSQPKTKIIHKLIKEIGSSKIIIINDNKEELDQLGKESSTLMQLIRPDGKYQKKSKHARLLHSLREATEHTKESTSAPYLAKRIVIIGGGTGQGIVARSLKENVLQINAVVTMADDGGSTGRLRKFYNAPAVGDIRNVLSQLGSKESFLTELFPYRYGGDRWDKTPRDIEGHVLGNLVILALIDKHKSLEKAIEIASDYLGITRHKVLPSTYDNIILCAELSNDKQICSQYKISHKLSRAKKFSIRKIWLIKKPNHTKIKANPRAVKAILEADDIIIGPGALHGSILPNIVISDIQNALKKSKAKKIYIANTAIKLAESVGMNIEDHLKALIKHSFPAVVDYILVNNKTPANFSAKIELLKTRKRKICSVPVIKADLIDEKNPFYHDPQKLRKVLLKIL